MATLDNALNTLLTSTYATQFATLYQTGATVHLGATAYNALLAAVTAHMGHAPATEPGGGFLLLGILVETP